MHDMEKVVKGLAHCTRPTEYGKGGNRCMDCPYTEAIGFNQFKCNGQQMMKDALTLLKEQQEYIEYWSAKYDEFGKAYMNVRDERDALLKEQEAVEPNVSSSEQRCGNCNKVIEMDGWKVCPWCGKKIDWEGWWKKNGTRNQDS